jgi:hypothetical protein
MRSQFIEDFTREFWMQGTEGIEPARGRAELGRDMVDLIVFYSVELRFFLVFRSFKAFLGS